MAGSEMVMVFCYDVADSKARRKVAAVLEQVAVRVQRSVFEARMPEGLARRTAEEAARLLGPGDSLRVYAVGAHGLNRSRAYGPLPLPEAQDFYLL